MVSFFYAMAPIVTRSLPTSVEWKGTTDLPLPISAAIYLFQLGLLTIAITGHTLYDSFAVMFISTAYYRYKILADTLALLSYSGARDERRDRCTMEYFYLLHLDVVR